MCSPQRHEGTTETQRSNRAIHFSASRLQIINSSANCLLHNFRFLITLIRITRPEETSEAIFSPSRHHMYVQMRNTLAHAIVHRDKRSVSLHSSFNCACQKLNAAKDGFN